MAREFNFADLRQSDQPLQSSRERRRTVMLRATLSVDGSPAGDARVRDISSGGMMADCITPVATGAQVAISLRGLGDLTGSIAWATCDRIGVLFDQPVDPSRVLRAPAGMQGSTYATRVAGRAWRPPLQTR